MKNRQAAICLKIFIGLLCLLIETSCLNSEIEQKLSDNQPTNTPTSIEDLQSALISAWGNADAMSMQPKEMTYVETSQQIQGGEPRYATGTRLEILEKIECALPEFINDKNCEGNRDRVVFHILQQVHENNESTPTSTDRFEIFIKPAENISNLKTSSLFTTTLKALASSEVHTMSLYPLSIDLIIGLTQLCIKRPNFDITCENLSVSSGLMDAPELVAKQPRCADLPNCKLRYKKVNFDAVITTNDPDTNTTTKDRIKYTVTISEDAPYLSRIIEYCYKGLVPVPSVGQKVLVNICNTVKNFKR